MTYFLYKFKEGGNLFQGCNYGIYRNTDTDFDFAMTDTECHSWYQY